MKLHRALSGVKRQMYFFAKEPPAGSEGVEGRFDACELEDGRNVVWSAEKGEILKECASYDVALREAAREAGRHG